MVLATGMALALHGAPAGQAGAAAGQAGGVAAQLAPAAAATRSLDEYYIKAQILLQLPAYVKWPSNWRQGRSFTLAVVGNSPFGSYLSDYASSKRTIQGRPIEVQYWRGFRALPECDMVFICRSEQAATAEISAWAGEHAVLTACENPRLTRDGVMVGLVLEGNRVKIHLNRQAMLGRGFIASSQLLGMAKLVGPDGPAK